jgi:hypothetical protein
MEALSSVDSEALDRMVGGKRGNLVIWLGELGDKRDCDEEDRCGCYRNRRI